MMRPWMYRVMMVGAFAWGLGAPAPAQTDTVPPEMPSTRMLEDGDLDSGGYAFIAGGHWYGAHENVSSKLPAATLYAGLERLNALAAEEVFVLGDVVRDATDSAQVRGFREFLQRLGGRHHVVPGNHDLLPDGRFQAALGACEPCLSLHEDQFLLLNTESLERGGGKAMLTQITALPKDCPGSRNLFVFSHRLLWALVEPGWEEMDDFANAPWKGKVAADTLKMVYEAVIAAAGSRNVHWFSGDIGASWSENAFYGQSSDGKRHFYAAGVGDGAEDAVWQVTVSGAGRVNARLVLLNGAAASPLSAYELDAWRTRMAARPGLRPHSIGKRLAALVRAPRFWIGLALGACLGVALTWAVRRLRQRRRA